MKKIILLLAVIIMVIPIAQLSAQVKALEVKNEATNTNLFSVLSNQTIQLGVSGWLRVNANDLEFSNNNSSWSSLTASSVPSTVLHDNINEIITGNFTFQNDLTVQETLTLGKNGVEDGELHIYSNDNDPLKFHKSTGSSGQYAEMGLRNDVFLINTMGDADHIYLDDDVIVEGDLLIDEDGEITFKSVSPSSSSSSWGADEYTIVNGTYNGNPMLKFEAHQNYSQFRFEGGDICYNQSLSQCSDRRYKKNIEKLASALDKLNKINGVYFDWRNETFPEMNFKEVRQIGVIAQELEEAGFPELVLTDGKGYKSVDYTKLSVILIEAVKELHSEHTALVHNTSKLTAKYEGLEQQQSLNTWLIAGFGGMLLMMIAIGAFGYPRKKLAYSIA